MKRGSVKLIAAGLIALLVSVLVLTSPLAASSTIDKPFAIDGVTRTLTPGQVDWYAFPYLGDESQIEGFLPEGTSFGIAFSVFTKDQVLRLPGDGVEPVGRGTFNEFGPVVLSWSGNFSVPGFYFVRVENTSVDPGSYVLRISSSSLRLP